MQHRYTRVRVTDVEASLHFRRDAPGLQVVRGVDVLPPSCFTRVYPSACGEEQAPIALAHFREPGVCTGIR